jgi:siroheme synthase-like protein
MLPLILNLARLPCLVVGCGKVGRRRLETLLEAGASVRVVCPDPAPWSEPLPGVTWIGEKFAARHLEGMRLVFAAATPDVNALVAVEASRRGILLNRADDAQASDFHIPAALRRGSVTVGISTGGVAPTLSRSLRDRLAAEWDESVSTWAELLAQLRHKVRDQLQPEQAASLLAEWSQWNWLERLRNEGRAGVENAMLTELRVRATQAARSAAHAVRTDDHG